MPSKVFRKSSCKRDQREILSITFFGLVFLDSVYLSIFPSEEGFVVLSAAERSWADTGSDCNKASTSMWTPDPWFETPDPWFDVLGPWFWLCGVWLEFLFQFFCAMSVYHIYLIQSFPPLQLMCRGWPSYVVSRGTIIRAGGSTTHSTVTQHGVQHTLYNQIFIMTYCAALPVARPRRWLRQFLILLILLITPIPVALPTKKKYGE